MKINHQTFCFSAEIPDHVVRYSCVKIRKINLQSIKARMVTKESYRHIPLEESPHWQFLNGHEEPYQRYLQEFGKDVGLEHSPVVFRALIKEMEEVGYLGGDHGRGYIIVQREGDDLVIRDGFHRACILLHSGEQIIPMAVLDEPDDQIDLYLNDFRDDFLEWYTPIRIDESRVIHERTFPYFEIRSEMLDNNERGEGKWKYIIERNLPDIAGKRVCDIGCNVGLFSYFMARMGAKCVHGYDRTETIVQPSNPELPRQNVVQQAYFVKNLLQLRDARVYDNLHFYEMDIAQQDFRQLRYDLFFSTCVLYHFGEGFRAIMEQVSENHRMVFLQTNLGHGGELAEYASLDYHQWLLHSLGYSVTIDAPEGYAYPVITGLK